MSREIGDRVAAGATETVGEASPRLEAVRARRRLPIVIQEMGRQMLATIIRALPIDREPRPCTVRPVLHAERLEAGAEHHRPGLPRLIGDGLPVEHDPSTPPGVEMEAVRPRGPDEQPAVPRRLEPTGGESQVGRSRSPISRRRGVDPTDAEGGIAKITELGHQPGDELLRLRRVLGRGAGDQQRQDE